MYLMEDEKPVKAKTKKQIEQEKREAKQREIDEDIKSQFDIRISIRNATIALNAVADKAEKICPGWNRAARQCIIKYPRAIFLAEDVVAWAYANGMEKPHDCRAWGNAFSKMSEVRFLTKHGYKNCRNINTHSRPVQQWIKELTGNEYTGDITADESEKRMLAEVKPKKKRKKKVKPVEADYDY